MEINPNLAAHGGNVQLVDLVHEERVGITAVLKFGGGCRGCSAVDMTLKQGVEVSLKQQIPELTQVIDENLYCQCVFISNLLSIDDTGHTFTRRFWRKMTYDFYNAGIVKGSCSLVC